MGGGEYQKRNEWEGMDERLIEDSGTASDGQNACVRACVKRRSAKVLPI